MIKDLRDVPIDMIAPMDKDTATIFIHAALTEKGEEFTPEIAATIGDPFATMMFNRLKNYGGQDCCISKSVGLFCGSLADRPGNAILWGYTLTRMYRQYGKIVDIHDIAKVFGKGFPTVDGYEFIWRNQKNGGVNLLDSPENWKGEY